MTQYICKVGSPDGKIVVMEMFAHDVSALRLILEQQGYHVFKIRKHWFQFLRRSAIGHRKVKQKDLLTFNQELLVLLKSGLPILQSLDAILERFEGSRFAELLTMIRDDVKGGLSLSAALERHDQIFPHLYIASVRAGERTGDLPQTIRRYCSYLKRAELVRKKIVSALFYPGILVSFAGIALAVLLIYVVPTFSKIYADAGSLMPLPTRILLSFSTGMKQLLPLFILCAVCAYAGLKSWFSTPDRKSNRMNSSPESPSSMQSLG